MGTVTRLFDGLANVLTGRGTTVDRGVHNFWMRRFTDQQQIEQAYLSSWLHRKIVDVPAQDMTRAGRDWDATEKEIEKIEAEEKRLGYWAKLREVVRLGRLGGGAIFIGLGDDQSKPLPTKIRPEQVQYLMVLSRWQLTIGELEADPASPGFMQPKYFEITGLSQSLKIHPSRMICFHGLPVPSITLSVPADDRFWGMSVVEACDEAVQQATTACTGFASLIDEAKIDVWKLSGIVDTLSQPGGEQKLTDRITSTNTGKSIHRAVILDKDDEWEQRQLNLAGIRDTIITFDGRVAGAANMPATKLFGKAPDGMNATGQGDENNYFQHIGSMQEMDLRPGMERLDAVMLPSAGVADTGLTWQFSPLRVLTEKESADIEYLEAQTVEKLANSGLIPESALAKSVQNRLIESQRFPGLQDAITKAEAAGEELPEGGEEELGIVPINGGKEADPTSAGGGTNAPARRAANDGLTKGQIRALGELIEDTANRVTREVTTKAYRAAVDSGVKPVVLGKVSFDPRDLTDAERAALKALFDATPRTLYVSRKVQNVADLKAWAKAQGLPELQDDLHVTIAYSTTPVDWIEMGATWADFGNNGKGELVITAGGPRVVEPLGDRTAVLMFASSDLSWRNREMREKGASWSWPDYSPHISLTAEPVDLASVEPYRGKIMLGPEIFEEIEGED